MQLCNAGCNSRNFDFILFDSNTVNDFETSNAVREDGDFPIVKKLIEQSPLFATVISMSITHSLAYFRFHEGHCPFLGIGVICVDLVQFKGQLLRSGPHRLKVSIEVDSTNSERGVWQIESDDGSFHIAGKEFRLITNSND